MTIFQAWKDSLNILQQKNLKVMVKSIADTFKIMFTRWWFLYALYIVLFYFFFNSFYAQFSELFTLTNDQLTELQKSGTLTIKKPGAGEQKIKFQDGEFTVTKSRSFTPEESQSALWLKNISVVGIIANLLIYFVLLFLTCLAARPSREPKTYDYFKKYFKNFWPLLLLMMALSVEVNGLTITIVNVYKIFLLYCILILSLFFFFDSKGSLRSFINAVSHGIKMMVYNLPLFLIIFGLRWLIIHSVNFSTLYSTGTMVYIYFAGILMQVILTPIIEICIIANIYNKKIRDQAELYE